MTRLGAILAAGFALLGAVQGDPGAREILQRTGVKGGLVIHLGCGDGRLTAGLRAGESYVVHGLDVDAKKVQAARDFLQAQGVYGAVSVEQWSGTRLPYADNLANLVVAADLGALPMAEVTRVLAPGGVAYVKANGAWTASTKPRPGDIDEWTHFLHDAGNNAVAADTRVGPPRTLQWVAPPLWLRSHETPSGIQAMVCGGGRLFYLLDEGLIGITDQRMPERWAIQCRDAFNGKLLWRRPIEPWGWPEWAKDKFAGKDWTVIGGGRTTVPDENQRRLVVDGDRLYATLGYGAPLSVLDAATGKTLGTLAETAPARQILCADGVVLVYSQSRDGAAAPKRRAQNAGEGTLFAIQGDTRAILWRKSVAPVRGLSLAIDQGRIIYQAGGGLAAADLKSGKELWQAETQEKNIRTLVVRDGAIAILGANGLEARDAATGAPLWHKQVPLQKGLGSEDLFVINGVVWPSILSVDAQQKPMGKGADALAVGYDLRTGAERKRVYVPELRSPEHHHRCYRNKATERFLISSMEGAEYLDIQGNGHCQNNFVRGACKLGMMPANGMLYVPPDQCFCQPGGKFLGFKALGPADASGAPALTDAQRLRPGPAFEQLKNQNSKIKNPTDWSTFRYDAARHGSTPAAVGSALADGWRAKLGGDLTAPVAAGGRVYVAQRNAHTLHAIDLNTGRPAWRFVAGGRIDSPPTIHEGRVLLGCADGWVYCLRAEDGALAWRFLAAPAERLVLANDQLESTWPVHGSVLVRDGVAYVTAGRSTYLDGGIRLWGLDPETGKILRRGVLNGPFPDGKETPRDLAFFIRGANSDVLVSEGDSLFMRQKRLTPALQEQVVQPLSNKGEADAGTHVFSTAGLLDDSWYNRTFWMYSKRWPGFQLANQAPKSGQLLVVDEANTYGVRVFYRRNLHSLMFFPGKEGYLLYADRNANEPQIVGEEGARTPVAWLPQSDYQASNGLRVLGSNSFGVDKGIGYTRAEPPLWTLWLPVRIRAMVKAGDTLFAAGPPDALDPKDPYAAFEGRKGASLVVVSAADGKKLAERPLSAPPVFDGMIAVEGRLLVAQTDGTLVCLRGSAPRR